MYMIIVGLGAIGRNLAMIAVAEKHNVVVIDTNIDRCKDVATKIDLVSIHGDATSMVVLEEAGINEADAVIATTGSDANNLMIMLLAKDKGVKKLTTIVNEREHTDIFKRAGVNIHKNPAAIVAEDIYNTMLRPSINKFVSMAGGKAEILEIIIKEGSYAADKTVKEMGLPGNVLIIAIERGDDVIIPEGNTVIQAGDSVYIFVRRNLVERVFNLFSIGNLEK
ncbi:potassium transporter [Methanocella sp. CWC-04]|uniref:Potassium transporter n=1 Tax=Methanooceanicella nereidis TaxID=2052831 RepID=A0AAP2W546_9EURY|nr:NAD-binding protein [Methanocella sp. CWC-04]MCD1293938.1 potassium transporter [Methanocella sp. CWC-04]